MQIACANRGEPEFVPLLLWTAFMSVWIFHLRIGSQHRELGYSAIRR
jgi:hypothetical protein